MTIHYVEPVIDLAVRKLCFKAYYNHPKGCPNFGKRGICPPQAPLINQFFDLNKRIIAIVVHFNLGLHRKQMKARHPNWSKRQCECCLYWQGRLRKDLKQRIRHNLNRPILFDDGNLVATDCPEAMGVDVTATMKNVGIILEWPPRSFHLTLSLTQGFRPS